MAVAAGRFRPDPDHRIDPPDGEFQRTRVANVRHVQTGPVSPDLLTAGFPDGR